MESFEMVAKTLAGLEEVLAEELRGLGAERVEPGRRMVSFVGDKAMLYKANLCCRTALRVLKPFYKFTAHTPDELYDQCKEFDWETILKPNSTFCIDTVAYSEDFTHSHYVTYRVKDAIVDWFRDKYGESSRPRVRLEGADAMINVHISGGNVTLSLDSSGESLHKRGYRVAQTEAPINEVLAAGIILMSGWRGDSPFVDPMCGSGTFLIEAALIAANINPGIYRKNFAFELWPDFDQELFDELYNDDSGEKEVAYSIIGADISDRALNAAMANIKSAGLSKSITLEKRPIALWEEAPQPAGVLITNPPYGERIKAPDMEGLYATIGNRLKNVFTGYHAWIIGYRDEYFRLIGLAPSQKIDLYNGALECELREYIIFQGDKKSFLENGGRLKSADADDELFAWNEPLESQENPVERFEKRQRKEERRERKFDRSKDGRRDSRDGEKRGPRREGRFGDERRPFKGKKEEWSKDKKERRFSDRDDRKRFSDDKPRDKRRFSEDDRRGSKGPRFSKDDRFSRDDRRDGRKDRFKDGAPKGFRKEAEQEQPKSENPLALRRNPDALRMLQNKMPSLPPTMRSRGWKKKDEDNEQ